MFIGTWDFLEVSHVVNSHDEFDKKGTFLIIHISIIFFLTCFCGILDSYDTSKFKAHLKTSNKKKLQ